MPSPRRRWGGAAAAGRGTGKRGRVLASEEACGFIAPDDGDLPTPGFSPVTDALAAIAAGRFVVVMDDESRENEGDLIVAADRVSPEAMAFMVRHTSGVVCVAMEGGRADELQLPLMVQDRVRGARLCNFISRNPQIINSVLNAWHRQMRINSAPRSVSPATLRWFPDLLLFVPNGFGACSPVVALQGGTPGISAAERAATSRALADPATVPSALQRPGHIFPLRARPVRFPLCFALDPLPDAHPLWIETQMRAHP